MLSKWLKQIIVYKHPLSMIFTIILSQNTSRKILIQLSKWITHVSFLLYGFILSLLFLDTDHYRVNLIHSTDHFIISNPVYKTHTASVLLPLSPLFFPFTSSSFPLFSFSGNSFFPWRYNVNNIWNSHFREGSKISEEMTH